MWETSAKSDLEIDTIETIFQSLAETLKLKTPLLEFPPHYSNIIQGHRQKGLNINESFSASNESLSRTKQRKPKLSKQKKKDVEKRKCCNTG